MFETLFQSLELSYLSAKVFLFRFVKIVFSSWCGIFRMFFYFYEPFNYSFVHVLTDSNKSILHHNKSAESYKKLKSEFCRKPWCHVL